MKEFKLIIAGSKGFDDYELLEREVLAYADSIPEDFSVSIVSGGARGADRLGEIFAYAHGAQVYRYPADWNSYGKSAGYIRNDQMALIADGLIAFWDGNSKGTKHMIDIMNRHQKPVYIVRY